MKHNSKQLELKKNQKPHNPIALTKNLLHFCKFSNKVWLVFGIIIVIVSFLYLNVSPVSAFVSLPALFVFFYNNFLPPNFNNITSHIPVVFSTVLFAIVSTYISAILAFVLGVLMSVLNPIAPLRGFVRFVVSFLRNVPLLIWGVLMVYIFGIGAMVGVVALVLASLGFLARSYAESINEIAATRLEALRSTGAGRLQVIFHGLIPEFIPAWINWTLFSFEINIRASAVLGMVGAGGLGLLIQTNMDLRSFPSALALVIILVMLVLSIEFLVNYIRRVLEQPKKIKTPNKFTKIYNSFVYVVIASVFFLSAHSLGLNLGLFFSRLENASRVIPLFIAFNPDIVLQVVYHLLISMAMGVCGLVLGCFVSFVLAFLAADNIAPSRILSFFIKAIVSVIRAVPSIILILMIVASLGFGYLSGVVGIMFASLGYLTKAFVSSIEEQDPAIIETMKVVGASWPQIVVHGLLPGLWSSFLSWISIRLEGNISDSISVGLVGAGGVGMLVARFIRQVNLPNLSTAVIIIFLAMVMIEFLVGRFKRKKI